MLDSVTKRRIDNLRNILVGKIPSPQSQVEQITTGLIYKFMYDMDVGAVEMGGVPSFFVDDYEKYSWKNLFDPKLGGADRVQLYSDAIEKMYTNPTAPPLFREIFKNSFLPFKDPAILNMFLKEINEFHYSHSEKLGDAFEYLLSFMDSQGDAGQFRTPRHIIDFIVEIVSPQKNETILDPACGTAGFLISSYKHILTQNTDKRLGDRLNAAERKQVGDNLVGYDIAPEMTRISLVNMYLHQFVSPMIHEYDTLSSEDRWNEYYDVILANPPFFSPKGGIQPHSRFGVQSTRAEVLFVDYIMEHLKPNGRAGIVVPEGIIFQTGTAYKTLRKKLVEDCLVGVISLPAGVFQPYSGVKTSVLILDKELNQKSDRIFFAKIENDGFSLGAQRTPIPKNDLPDLLTAIHSKNPNELCVTEKNSILTNPSISLSQPTYTEVSALSSDYPIVKIGDVFSTSSGGTPKAKEEKYYLNGNIPWARSGEVDGKLILDTEIKITELGLKESSAKLFPINSVLVAMYGATAGKVGMLGIEASTNQAVCAIFPNENCLPKYLYHLLRSQEDTLVGLSVGGAQPNISQTIIKDFEIPLPPIEIQQQIVDELDGYQKIIDGCRQVVENYKPTIDIDPSWEMVELSEMATTEYGTSEKSLEHGKYGVLRMGNLQGGEIDFSDLVYSNNEKDFKKLHLVDGDILFNRTNSPELVGKTSIFRGHDNSMIFAGYLVRVKIDESKLRPEYLNAVLNSPYGKMLNDKNVSVSGNQANINATKLRNYPIPTPSLDVQERICSSLDAERKLVFGNKKLIENYTHKIQDRISKVWGE